MSPLDLLSFKAFKPNKSDLTVPLNVRYDVGDRLLVIHFRATNADVLVVERSKRNGWNIIRSELMPISEASIREKLEYLSEHSGYAVIMVGSGFEIDLPTSLRSEPEPEAVLNDPASVIPQATNSRVYAVHSVGTQYMVVSHTKQTVANMIRIVESAGLVVTSVQSSIFGMLRSAILPSVRDRRTILTNGAGYVIVEQDVTGRIIDMAQYSADSESRICDTLRSTLLEMTSEPNSVAYHDGSTGVIANAIQPTWGSLAQGDDARYLIDQWNDYYHLFFGFEATDKALPRSWMPVMIGVWVVLLGLTGQMLFNAGKIGLAIRHQQQIKTEITAIGDSLKLLGDDNNSILARRDKCRSLSAWIRGRENHQRLIANMIHNVPSGVIVRNVSVREKKESSPGTMLMYTFSATVEEGTPVELADRYFTTVREQIASDGWLIAESVPSLTSIRIQATRRGVMQYE